MPSDADKEWSELWDARLDGISTVLGRPYDGVWHSPVPFQLGGNADVVAFPAFQGGIAYVTAELSGGPKSRFADYELMICLRQPSDWAPSIISRLAPYTQKAYIAATESMDIDGAAPAGSPIKAFVFDTFGTVKLFDSEFELRLCIGITKAELDFKMKHGGERLLELLKKQNVHPFTELERESIRLHE